MGTIGAKAGHYVRLYPTCPTYPTYPTCPTYLTYPTYPTCPTYLTFLPFISTSVESGCPLTKSTRVRPSGV